MVTLCKHNKVLHDRHCLSHALPNDSQLLLELLNIHAAIARPRPLQGIHHVDKMHVKVLVESQLAVMQGRPYQMLQAA